MSKSFASLTGSMLARKTALRPAADLSLEGSNDLEWSAPEPAAIPVAAEVPDNPLLVSKPAPLAKVVPLVRPVRAGAEPKAPHATGLKPLPVRRTRPAAFTLRLDPDRHLRLRLACNLRDRSAQSLVTEAVDRLLAEIPDIEALADRISAQTIIRPLWDNKP